MIIKTKYAKSIQNKENNFKLKNSLKNNNKFFAVLSFLFILFVNSFFNFKAFALTDEQLEQRQLIIQQQQEQRRLDETNKIQLKEVEKIKSTKPELKEEKSDLTEREQIIYGDSCTVKFKLIRISGNEVFSVKTLKEKVLKKYLGQCINKNNIQGLQNELMKFYINHGYSNARVYFDFAGEKIDNIKKGIFDVVIEEGKVKEIDLINIRERNKLNKKIEKIKNKRKEEYKDKNKDKIEEKNIDKATDKSTEKDIDKTTNEATTQVLSDKDLKYISKLERNSFGKTRNKMQKFFAFPFLEGKEFNLRDYEQGLDQINRLSSNNATMDIKALYGDSKDKYVGYSKVVITNNNILPLKLKVAADNSGSKSTGERLGSISLSADNLISINDYLYVKYTQDLDSENSKRYNKAFYSSFSFPFGYWTFTNSLSYSRYLTTIYGYNTSYHTNGNTLTQSYNLDRVLFRRRNYKINSGTELTIRDTESWTKGYKSITGTRKSSNINFYLNNIFYTKLGTIIVKPSYQKGLDWFNSKRDSDDLLNTEARNQYDLVKLYTYYNTRFNLPLLSLFKGNKTNDFESVNSKEKKENKKGKKLPLNYTLTFSGQYSWNTLYGTDQFSVGGEYTVRGFRENTISGDNGYTIRNDLRVNVKDLLPNCLSNLKVMNFGNKINGKRYNLSLNDALSKTYLSFFYDYGFVEDKYTDSSDDEYNSGKGYMSGTGIALSYYGNKFTSSLTYAKALHAPKYLQTRDGLKREGSSIYWNLGVEF